MVKRVKGTQFLAHVTARNSVHPPIRALTSMHQGLPIPPPGRLLLDVQPGGLAKLPTVWVAQMRRSRVHPTARACEFTAAR